MKRRSYQRVMGDRPLGLSVLDGQDSLQRRFGPGDGARQAFDTLRESARSAGLGQSRTW